jgi:hypothetical protein
LEVPGGWRARLGVVTNVGTCRAEPALTFPIEPPTKRFRLNNRETKAAVTISGLRIIEGVVCVAMCDAPKE